MKILPLSSRAASDPSIAIEHDRPHGHRPPVTRFGDVIDVRNRGALKVGRFAGSQAHAQAAPAVVRLWTDEQFRELTAHQARSLAAQLLAAASLAELQNSH